MPDDPRRAPAAPARRDAERAPVADVAVSVPAASDSFDGSVGPTLGDLPLDEFRAAGHRVVDLIADYLATVEDRTVFPPIEPGTIRPLFPSSPPEEAEPLDRILDDYVRLVEPNATHWQHPGFLAYFATSSSEPGILGEMLTAALGQNPMLWRTSPIGTELEEVVVDWLRQALGLPDSFDGLLTDTASTSTLMALAAARQATGRDVATRGLTGRDEPALRVYGSTETHSSIEKACMTLGLGRDSLVRIPTDADYALDPAALEVAVRADAAAGRLPIAVVATIGTTSSTAIDPVDRLADLAAAHGMWLHVDAAYGGAAALIPEMRSHFRGWERADSIVTNPHKWFFTPLEASLLLTRRMDVLRDSFSLVPEYLRTLDRETPGRDYNEYTPQLGRRFRSLKLWMLIRAFGVDGLRRRVAAHIALAQELAHRIEAEHGFELLAPTPFSTVCFRYAPAWAGGPGDSAREERLDALNASLMDAVNRTGEVFLSHTRLDGRFTIRVAIGNIRTEPRHVARAWEIIRREAAALDPR